MEASNENKSAQSDYTEKINLADSYFEDEAIYPEYKETEAEQIINPTEEILQKAESDEKAAETGHDEIEEKKKRSLIRLVLRFFSDFIYALGENTIDLFKWFFRKTGPFLLLPLAFVATFVSKSAKSIFRYLSDKPKKIRNELNEIKEDRIRNGKKATLFTAFRVRFLNPKLLMKTAFNLAFPIVALVFVFTVYQNVRNSIFALEVIYKGQSIGYVENQQVFDEGKDKAVFLLNSGSQDKKPDELIAEPVYKVKRVNVNELSNAGIISESLIKNSGTEYVRACGIYIDGNFLCAVKNESDAQSVFEGILEPYKKKAGDSGTVAFVEEIEYIQGLYPENSELIWNAVSMRKALTQPKSEAVYHTMQEGDTVRSVLLKYGLSGAQLKALNPDTDFSAPEAITTLLVARQTNHVRVKVMKTRVTKQILPYETIKQNSSSLAKGTSKTTQEGANGEVQITELVTYIDGVESYSTVVSQKQIKEPVNRIILVGTKTYTAESSGYTWPTRGAYAISSYYGYRSASISGWGFHGGIDIVRGGGGTSGTPVVAAASGTVEVAYSGYSGYGHTVVINHGNGVKTRYAHMYPGSICVRVGQKVSKGQQIGKIGTTGNSTGPHLHFEVIVNGSKVDPLKYVRR